MSGTQESADRTFDNLLSVRDKSVLMVDDNPDVRSFIGRFVEYFGARVEFAKDGLEAIEKALTGTYDVVLMDIAMPICDGIEATKRLRRGGYKQPIICVSAQPMNGNRRNWTEIGFNDYLVKPVNRMQLLYAVANQTRVAGALH